MAMASIHKMALKDLARVHVISQHSFASPWSLDAIQHEFYNDMAYYLVAREDGETVGFIGAWLVFDEVQITNIAVDPACRRHGIARLLLGRMLADMKDKDMSIVFLEVRVSNEAARKLYESHGFQYAGYRKKFYPDGEDAHIMSLDL